MIATNQSVKQRKEDEESGKNYMKFGGDTFWLMSEDELVDSFGKYHPELSKNLIQEMINASEDFADRCEDFSYDKSPKIPKATDSPQEAEAIIRDWCEEGLARIGKQSDAKYLERLEHEISVMRKLNVLDYFVIVGDMVRWAKDQGIRVGAGRGSAAGSLVNYLSRITAIDPIGYDLIFERFLNEYRTELPDIDIDFQDDRRDEVKAYLKSKWGEDYVVDIGAFQSFGHKGVIQDVGRVLNLPYMELKKATDDIPQASKIFGVDLRDISNSIPSVGSLFEKYPELEKHCMRLFGQMKAQSKHAAAVVVTDRPAHDLIPMMRSKEEGMVTQWGERGNAQLISPNGFLKIDCLAVDELSVQQETIDLIKERHGEPTQLPADFTELAPKEIMRLHSIYNAYYARARWMLAVTSNKLSNVLHLRDAEYRRSYREISDSAEDKKPTKDYIDSLARQDVAYVDYDNKAKLYSQDVEAYKALTEIYGKDVDRLSREWTMRQDEENRR